MKEAANATPRYPDLFGHPRGLYLLFLTEMWERFCYFGMRGLLVLYLTKALFQGDDQAFAIYGAYTALVYMAPVLGGRLADRILGYRIAVMLGAVLMAIGEFLILGGSQSWLYVGMAAIIVGNGYFKANISSLVGKLYTADDPRRDSGFTIFYIGVNVGALLATLVVVWVGERFGFKYGFGLAGIGMLLGLLIFAAGTKYYKEEGRPPRPETLHAKVLGPLTQLQLTVLLSFLSIPLLYLLVIYNTVMGILLILTFLFVGYTLLKEGIRGGRILRDRMIIFIILCLFNVLFWALFEQAGSSLTLFADRNVNRNILGIFEMTAGQTQFFNPFFIVVMGSLFSMLWVKLSEHNLNPNIPAKFGYGIILLGIGYLITRFGLFTHNEAYLVPLWIIIAIYFFHTVGELFISPIGLSMVTKLAPEKLSGTLMGAWFLSFSGSNFLGGQLAKLTHNSERIPDIAASVETVITGTQAVATNAETVVTATTPAALESLTRYIDVYTSFGLIAVATGLVVLILSPRLNKLMHGIK
ncbi:MAG: peptide MFS transporter [Proteiniphilum sp.]|jgi:POT family proton-dependent oligopeptide transporter|nr:peptide MFS transporter [Proteiniphilum sp.]